MKKFLIALIGFVFISGLAFSQEQTNDSIDQISGSIREILFKKIEMIETFTQAIGKESGKVTGSDLSKLKDMVFDFLALKGELLKETYASFVLFEKTDAPKLAFVFDCQEAVDAYFDHVLQYKDDSVQTVKRFFKKYTGREMEIERTKEWAFRITVLGLICGAFIAVIIGLVVAEFFDNEGAGVATFIIVFIVWFFLFLFVF